MIDWVARSCDVIVLYFSRGLFLKNGEEEQIFGTGECPCEVLFEVDASGKVTRLPVG